MSDLDVDVMRARYDQLGRELDQLERERDAAIFERDRAEAAVARARELADWFDAQINWREWGIGNQIRHALEGS